MTNPSGLSLHDVRRLLAGVDDDLAAVRGWEPARPFRDDWARSLLLRRQSLAKVAARLGRGRAETNGTADKVLAETLDRR